MDGYTKLGGVFGGGGSNPACNRFCWGYMQGANAAALVKYPTAPKTVEVKISFNNGETFSASTELQTYVSQWYASGTEIVFSCGGSMVNSVIAAAGENEGEVIGVDTDQANLSTRILTSAVKGLAPSVQKVLAQYYAGEWDEKLADKTSNLGAADDATGLPTADESWRFEHFTKEEYNTLFNSIKNGTVVINNETPKDASKAGAWAVQEALVPNISFVHVAAQSQGE